MRKRSTLLSFIALSVMVPAALFAGGQAENKGKSNTQQVTLQLAELWGGTGTRATLYDARLTAFQQKYPSIKLNVTTVPVPQYQNQIQVLLAANTLPDTFPFWPGGRSTVLFKANALADLTDFINTDLKGRFPQAQLQSMARDGKYYGVPTETAFMGTFANSDLFHQYGLPYPATWADLMNDVKVFNEHGIVPISQAGGSNGLFLPIIYQYIVLDLISNQEYEDAITGRSVSKGFEAAAKYLKELYDAHAFEPGMLSATREESDQLFNQGKAAMFVFGNFMIESWSPETVKRTVFIPFPTIPNGNPNAEKTNIYDPGMAYVVNKPVAQDSAKFDAVKKFMDYMTEDNFAQEMQNKAGVGAPNSNVKPDPQTSSKIFISMVDRFTNPNNQLRMRMMMSMTPGSANIVDKDLQALLLGTLDPAAFYQDISKALMANQ